MKHIHLPQHTVQNLSERKIPLKEVEKTLQQPEYIVDGYDGRKVFMRKYHDERLEQEMLLRVVVEEYPTELIVVTVYKTSQIERYLKGL